MKRLYAIIFMLASVVSFHCQKEVNYADLPEGIDPYQQQKDVIIATVQGNVTDETGKPASGVSIKAGNKVAMTDQNGYFRIINAVLGKDAAVITAGKAGYFKSYRTFIATAGANHVVLKLIKKQLAGTIPASGGEVTFGNGAKLSLPANAVVRASGGSFSGETKVFSAYIDPTADDISSVVPGSFMADDKSGKRVTLASFGMVAVELESASGERLQVASTAEAKLTMPIPSSIRSEAPSSISLWSVDEKTGLWKEEGKAARVGDTYVGSVKHFSFWNCDIGLPATHLSMKLVSKSGTPLIHARVKLSAPNSNIMASYGYTDSLGIIEGLVPSGTALLLEVLDECNTTTYSQNIAPLSTATDLGNVTVLNSTALYTVSGRVVNCSNAAVKNGSVQIICGYTTIYATCASDGTFSVSFVRCGSQSGNEISVTGFDNAASQMGTPEDFTLALAETNIGEIKACGTSTEEYLNYSIDGVEYSITSIPATNFMAAFVAPNMDSSSYATSIYAMSSSGADSVAMEFRSPQKIAGSYPLRHVDLRGYTSITPMNPINVNLTRFGAEAFGIFEGSFGGRFIDSLDQTATYMINVDFRIRRY